MPPAPSTSRALRSPAARAARRDAYSTSGDALPHSPENIHSLSGLRDLKNDRINGTGVLMMDG